MSQDKIFKNNLDQSEYEYDPFFSFELHPSIQPDHDEEEKIYFEKLDLAIHEAIEKSHQFKQFNYVDEHGNTKKLKKKDINKVFQYLMDELKESYNVIDIFSETCNYFVITPKKLYSSLNNNCKEQLVQILDQKTNALSKRNIQKLF